jgi:hypothetical protein
VALSTLGFAGAFAMSRGEPLRTAVARLHLGPWVGLGFAGGYGAATLVWWSGDLNYRGLATRDNLAAGAVVAGAGFVALVLGYFLVPRFARHAAARGDRLLRGERAFAPGARSVCTLLGLFLVGQALMYRSGNFGYLSDPTAALSASSSAAAAMDALSQMGVLATLTAAWRYAVSRRAASLALMALVVVPQVGLGLFSGVKETAIVQLFAVVVGLSARGSLRARPLVVAALVTFLVISPFVTAYRAVVLQDSGRLSPSQALRSVDFTTLLTEAVAGGAAAEASDSGPADRWSRIGDVTIIAAQTPDPIPYQSPLRLAAAPILGLVPRSLWREKPVLDAGYQVNQQYYRMPPTVYSSAAVTPYGDLYRHGGYPILILGMLGVGALVRLIDSRERQSAATDPRVLFLPMLLFPVVVKQEIDMMSFLASLPGVIVAAGLAARLTSATQQQARDAARHGTHQPRSGEKVHTQ